MEDEGSGGVRVSDDSWMEDWSELAGQAAARGAAVAAAAARPLGRAVGYGPQQKWIMLPTPARRAPGRSSPLAPSDSISRCDPLMEGWASAYGDCSRVAGVNWVRRWASLLRAGMDPTLGRLGSGVRWTVNLYLRIKIQGVMGGECCPPAGYVALQTSGASGRQLQLRPQHAGPCTSRPRHKSTPLKANQTMKRSCLLVLSINFQSRLASTCPHLLHEKRTHKARVSQSSRKHTR